jgi:tetratricopeptide (TPR) repeat protein
VNLSFGKVFSRNCYYSKKKCLFANTFTKRILIILKYLAMKKAFLFVTLIIFAGNMLTAQKQCVENTVLSLGKKEITAAKREIDKCFPDYQSSAEIWLARATVYVQFYEFELDRKKRDPKYVVKSPDALIIANESFYEAMVLKPDIKPTIGLFDPKEGQLITAEQISIMATTAMENKNYTEAIKLLNLVTRSYRVDPKGSALYLAYASLDIANCYREMGDEDNYKKTLLDAAKLNVPVRNIFLQLYNLYEKEQDTTKCGEVLAQARKLIPDDLEIKGYELSYFAMLGDTTNLKIAAKAIFEQTKTNPDGIAFVVEYMVDNKEYLLAEEMIETGIAIAPDDFDLNLQMTYRYFYEAEDFEKIRDAKLNERPRNTEGAKVAEAKRDELWEKGVFWAEKAYNINKDDVKLNKMYNYMLLRLRKNVPEDLIEKIDSYNKSINE